MHRRALIVFWYLASNEYADHPGDGWDVVDLPWPPTREDLQSALTRSATKEVAAKVSADFSGELECGIVSLTWIGAVHED